MIWHGIMLLLQGTMRRLIIADALKGSVGGVLQRRKLIVEAFNHSGRL